jgi:hypothetical protein
MMMESALEWVAMLGRSWSIIMWTVDPTFEPESIPEEISRTWMPSLVSFFVVSETKAGKTEDFVLSYWVTE